MLPSYPYFSKRCKDQLLLTPTFGVGIADFVGDIGSREDVLRTTSARDLNSGRMVVMAMQTRPTAGSTSDQMAMREVT